MITKKKNDKVYAAKVNLPGCAAGRQIQNGKYMDDNSPCPYNCANEPGFFIKVPQSKHKTGDKCILQKQESFEICNHLGTATGRRFTLPAFTEAMVVGVKQKSNNCLFLIISFGLKDHFYLVPEEKLHAVEKYFYLSSKGDIHPTWIRRDEKADKFRKTVGNYHQTKAAAEKYRNSLVAKVK